MCENMLKSVSGQCSRTLVFFIISDLVPDDYFSGSKHVAVIKQI
jgi:hypothetical protein